jgi:hypothetical protein
MSSNSISTKGIRKFGCIALFFFGALCALGFWVQKPVPTYFFGLLSTLGFGFILFPFRLRFVYAGWLTIAHFIGRIITILILTLAYYMVITPSAIIKRLFGGRPLPVRPDKQVSSYWVTREEQTQTKVRFLKRF